MYVKFGMCIVIYGWQCITIYYYWIITLKGYYVASMTCCSLFLKCYKND